MVSFGSSRRRSRAERKVLWTTASASANGHSQTESTCELPIISRVNLLASGDHGTGVVVTSGVEAPGVEGGATGAACFLCACAASTDKSSRTTAARVLVVTTLSICLPVCAA